MKKILFLFALLMAIVGGLVFIQNYSKKGNVPLFKKSATVKINNQSFKTTVAKSQKEREIGLSETKSISDNQGMIFLFDKPDYYSFWMKNMKFPIDIIYINSDTIVSIVNDAPLIKDRENPAIYSSTKPADKVLEIKAGLSEKYKFKEGDKVTYENLGN